MSESLWDKLNNAKPRIQRDDRITPGNHVLALRSMEEQKTRNLGKAVMATFVVIESDTLAEGQIVGAQWYIGQMDQDRADIQLSQLRAFCVELLNLGDTDPVPRELVEPHQPARGKRIKCSAKVGKPMKKDPTQFYTELVWRYFDETSEQIIETRGVIDQHFPVRATPAPSVAAPAPVVQPAPAPAPAPMPAPAAQPVSRVSLFKR